VSLFQIKTVFFQSFMTSISGQLPALAPVGGRGLAGRRLRNSRAGQPDLWRAGHLAQVSNIFLPLK
jgi:hypothetical protein